MEEENGKGIYLSTDKAEEKVKKGMTKVLSKWSRKLATTEFPDGQVYTCTLDSDAVDAKTNEGADGTVHSLKKLPNHTMIKLLGVNSDSGGGFITEGKKEALFEREICHGWALVGNCTLHDIQLTGTVPMKHLLGTGGIGAQNLLQTLFLSYTMQQEILGR
jgi:NAD kinase